MKTAGIRDLKAHLSAYLHQVERGETLLVTDRGRVVATVRPPDAADRIGDASAQAYAKLVERGAVRPAPEPDDRSWSTWRGCGLRRGSARAILDADRGE